MRRFIGLLAGLLAGFLGLPSLALADCGGSDRLAALASGNPAAHAEILRRAEGVANGRGLFWRVESGGAPPSYLFGTFLDPEVAAEPQDPAVLRALEAARVMLVEITLEEQQEMQARMATDPAFVFAAEAPMISARLGPQARASAEAALAGRGLTLALADRLRPALLMSILAQPKCALDAMAAGKPVLDTVLMSRAAAAGVPVVGMETYEAALASIDRIDPEIAGALLVEAIASLDQLEDFRRTALLLYRAGEMAVLQEYEIWQAETDFGAGESRRLHDAMTASVLDARNHDWMAVMVPEMERGGVFAAFGAMHLTGARGIIELLRARGFTVTRLDG